MEVEPFTARKGPAQTDDDLYNRLKRAQRQVEMLDIQEEYIKDEMKNLKRELIRAQEEVKRIQVRTLYTSSFAKTTTPTPPFIPSSPCR